jgi:sugar (pentulose or hexulose) kinase
VSTVLAAVDLGASSGRVVAAVCDGNRIGLDIVARFPNRAVAAGGRLYWDVFGLWSGVLDGLRTLGDAAAAQHHRLQEALGSGLVEAGPAPQRPLEDDDDQREHQPRPSAD